MKRAFALVVTLGAVALCWPGPAAAWNYFYEDKGCVTCHGPTRTCAGCHSHGTHGLSSMQDFNVTATASKAFYTAGEDVVVTIKGGYLCGWVRVSLLDDQMVELAKSSGPGGLGNGADACTTGGIQLRAPAPAQPGSYVWYGSWFGNKFDKGDTAGGTSTVFGPSFRDG